MYYHSGSLCDHVDTDIYGAFVDRFSWIRHSCSDRACKPSEILIATSGLDVTECPEMYPRFIYPVYQSFTRFKTRFSKTSLRQPRASVPQTAWISHLFCSVGSEGPTTPQLPTSPRTASLADPTPNGSNIAKHPRFLYFRVSRIRFRYPTSSSLMESEHSFIETPTGTKCVCLSYISMQCSEGYQSSPGFDPHSQPCRSSGHRRRGFE
jgi:hypothetical protein